MKQRKAVNWSCLFAAGLLSVVSSVLAAEPNRNGNLVEHSVASSFINNLITQSPPTARPLIKIGTLQAWVIEDDDGEPVLALTTNEGLTIIGQVIGPQGEDISGALLAAVPRVVSQASLTSQPDRHTRPKPSFPVDNQPETLTSNELHQSDITSNVTATTNGTSASQSRGATASVSIAPNPFVTSQDEGPAAAAGPTAVTAVDAPSLEIQAGLNKLLEDAASKRMWFRAATPQPGAPVIYMLADPDCPHCQWSIDSMRPLILSGQIDLRIIPAPITGQRAFATTLSILHSKDVAGTFMNHMTSKTRGTPAVVQMDTAKADENVVNAIAENINWMRLYGIQAVPFFFYKDAEGARFSASALPDNILQVAKSF